MSTEIYYFSGTGNSFYVASELQKRLPDARLMPIVGFLDVGQTAATGFQVGVRKTLPISLECAWGLLTSTEGINVWIGEAPGLQMVKGQKYETLSGVSGMIRVVNPLQNLRITWKPVNWQKPSIVQVRVIPAGKDKTTISFHQENLPDQAARLYMRDHWQKVLDTIEKALV